MRSEEEYRRALQLIDIGINDCEIGRRLGIPRGTIRDWRVALQAGSAGRTKFASYKREVTCFRCTNGWVDEEAYAYLLGEYLGDGCLSLMPRDVYRLRIACDEKYPHIIGEIAASIVKTHPSANVGFVQNQGCVEVYSFWKHWLCLFPQHGPGRKHQRRIELAPWQSQIVVAHPKELVRGLIHSDGNRHINPITRRLPSGIKRYRYTRYQFTNASTDILAIFTDALDLLGIHWTRTTARDISVARRDDVAYLDTFVGPKR
jgi:Homeodomain-like domain